MLQRVWLVVDLFAGVIGFHRDMGLAHGDIKPANMLYKHRNGRHRGTLCDAGLAMSGDTLAAYQRNGVVSATTAARNACW
jgi:serine/threonine protein kinase